MRRFDLCLLVSGVLAFSTACGSSSPGGPGNGGAGHGGAGGGTSGTGGGTSGTGGGASGTGGGTSGTGGGTSGTGGGTSGSSGMDGGAGRDGGGSDVDAAVDMPSGDTSDASDAGDAGLTTTELRGQYLANSVLGCAGCHTPQKVGGGGADTTKAFSGVDCFVTGTNLCLSSANLTNDATGIKSLTDQQVIDAFTKGIFPGSLDGGGTQYLFANMPYYQFSNLTASDAAAIVAYLRALPAVAHTGAANSGTFATRPTAAQWTPVALADLPNPNGGVDAGATSLMNGKYLGALICSTCHTVNTGAVAPAPLQLDATKAFQGGKTSTVTVTVAADAGTDGGDGGTTSVSKQIESANLTPDVTGLAGWTAPQISTAITAAKDNMGRSICGMRALSGLAAQDATDVANYFKAIPAVSNAITMTCY
jgi:hypothetical protein